MNLNIVFILTLFVFVLSNPIIHDEEIDFNLTFNQRDSTKEKEEIVNNSIYVVIVVIILILFLVILLIFCVWFCFCKKNNVSDEENSSLKVLPNTANNSYSNEENSSDEGLSETEDE